MILKETFKYSFLNNSDMTKKKVKTKQIKKYSKSILNKKIKRKKSKKGSYNKKTVKNSNKKRINKPNLVCLDLDHLKAMSLGTPLRMFKAYLSGLWFPATIVSILIPMMLLLGMPTEVLYYFPLSPILWGLVNLFYIEFVHYEPAKHHLGLVGVVLGFILAIYNVFYLEIPIVLGILDKTMYAPLVVIPLGYYVLWRFIVHPSNVFLGLHD